jgi:hypothetical protein
MTSGIRRRLGLTGLLLLNGCIGLDRAASFTSDNFGLNLATAPTPTIAIS